MVFMTFNELRARHPRFIYRSFQSQLTNQGLELSYQFELEPNIVFQPQVVIEGVQEADWLKLDKNLREQWVFQLGLAEIPSYWKAAASPEIVIEAGHLDQAGLEWWQQLLIEGMGEYFFVNQIDFTQEDLVKWSVTAPAAPLNSAAPQAQTQPQSLPTAETTSSLKPYLVPLGGGKDSSLTVSLFHQHHPFGVFLLNPTPAMTEIAHLAEPIEIITAQRTIDPNLLALNQAGYLNGHVPFSAYLGLLSRLVGEIFNYQSIVISNERSSNEGNVQFLGSEINHQWSKTYEFEQAFEKYLHQAGLVKTVTSQVTPDQAAPPAYFSLLRPLYELQISRLLANSPLFNQIAPVFRSCNRGQKTNSWCGQCPKCLFTFISLYPFLPDEIVISIFGENLLEKTSLFDEALALLGKTETKPFECVGTREESLAAFYLCWQKFHQTNLINSTSAPALLNQVWEQVLSQEENLADRSQAILQAWNDEHQVPAELTKLLKAELAAVEETPPTVTALPEEHAHD